MPVHSWITGGSSINPRAINCARTRGARVEDLELRAHAELADLARHRAKHRGRVHHHVVAAPRSSSSRSRACRSPGRSSATCASRSVAPAMSVPSSSGGNGDSPPRTRSPPIPAVEVHDDVDLGRADALHDLAVEREVARMDLLSRDSEHGDGPQPPLLARRRGRRSRSPRVSRERARSDPSSRPPP